MSAFGPKATRRKTQSMSLLGVKRTWAGAVQMSAFDPKRTSGRSGGALPCSHRKLIRSPLGIGGMYAAARIYRCIGRDGRLATDRAGATEIIANRHSSYRWAGT